MRVLTRKQGESINIGNDVKVILLDTPDNQQCIGIIAPREVPVHRSEVYDRIQARSEVQLLTDERYTTG